MWNSGSVESTYGWNYIPMSPYLLIEDCCIDLDPFPMRPRILIVATHIGTDCSYPSWGMDNISSSIEIGCQMHDRGCYNALYPRPYISHYQAMHSGYYGVDFEYCPPQWFADGRETTETYDEFGFLELAWRLYVHSRYYKATEPATWGTIKAMFR